MIGLRNDFAAVASASCCRPALVRTARLATMPLQNRVYPFGELFATPARGTLMGNRGGHISSR